MKIYEDRSEISKDAKVTVIMFSSSTCSACPTAIENLKRVEDHEGVFSLKVDVDRDQVLPSMYHVMSLPSFVFLKGNDPVFQLNGIQTVDKIEEIINRLI